MTGKFDCKHVCLCVVLIWQATCWWWYASQLRSTFVRRFSVVRRPVICRRCRLTQDTACQRCAEVELEGQRNLMLSSHCVTSILPLAINTACSVRCIHMLYVAYMTNDLLLIFHVFIRLPGYWNIRGPLVVWPTMVDDSEWPLDIHLFWLFAYHFVRICVITCTYLMKLELFSDS